MTTRERLAHATRTVREHPLLVLMLACTSLHVTCHSTALFLWLSLAATLLLTPAVYGRFAQVVAGEPPIPLVRVFLRHGFDFYLVLLLFFAPFVVALVWVRKDLAPLFLDVAFAAAQVLLIYVLPGVFQRRSPLEAVTAGLAFLARNAQPSLPLIGLALLNPLLHQAIPSSWTALDLSSFRAAALTLPFALLYNTVLAAVNLTLFVAAGMTLRSMVHPVEQRAQQRTEPS